MIVKLVNFPEDWIGQYGGVHGEETLEVTDDTEAIVIMIEEHNLPGNEGTDDHKTVHFVSREIPIIDGVADWETMRLPH